MRWQMAAARGIDYKVPTIAATLAVAFTTLGWVQRHEQRSFGGFGQVQRHLPACTRARRA